MGSIRHCEILNIVKRKNPTILSSPSSDLKVKMKMVKAVVRFKWLHFYPKIVTRTLKALIYNILLTNILL